MSPQPEAFTLHVPESVIADLRERLARTRLPDQAPGAPWAYGTDVAYMRELVDYWRDGFDWRAAGGAAQRLPAVQGAARTASTCTSFTSRARARRPARCCSRTAGPARSSSSSTSSRGSPTRPASAAIPPTRSPSSRRRCPATACRSRPASRASASRRSPTASPTLMTDVLGYERFAAQGGDWGAFVTSRLGYTHRRAPDRHPPQPHAAAARPQMVGRPDPRGAPVPRRARALAQGRDRLPVDPGHAAADARLRRSPTRPPGWPPGSSRSSAPGPIAAATSRACSRRTSCWPTSASTGSPARSARRSGRTTRACTGHGRSPRAGRSTCRPATASSRARSCARRARWRSAPTPTSAAGARCQRGGHFAAMEQPEALAREVARLLPAAALLALR